MEFSTRSALRFGWETFKKRARFFVGSTVVILLASGLINTFSNAIDGVVGGSAEAPTFVGIAVNLGLGTLLSMGATAFYLARRTTLKRSTSRCCGIRSPSGNISALPFCSAWPSPLDLSC